MTYTKHDDIVPGGTINSQTIKDMDEQIFANTPWTKVEKLAQVSNSASGSVEKLCLGLTKAQLKEHKAFILAVNASSNTATISTFMFGSDDITEPNAGGFLSFPQATQIAELRMSDDKLVLDGYSYNISHTTTFDNQIGESVNKLTTNGFYNTLPCNSNIFSWCKRFNVQDVTELLDTDVLWVKCESTSTTVTYTYTVYALD